MSSWNQSVNRCELILATWLRHTVHTENSGMSGRILIEEQERSAVTFNLLSYWSQHSNQSKGGSEKIVPSLWDDLSIGYLFCWSFLVIAVQKWPQFSACYQPVCLSRIRMVSAFLLGTLKTQMLSEWVSHRTKSHAHRMHPGTSSLTRVTAHILFLTDHKSTSDLFRAPQRHYNFSCVTDMDRNFILLIDTSRWYLFLI